MAKTEPTLTERTLQNLLGRITSGEWGPGSMLPSEFKLAEMLAVSQGTARKAVGLLEARGIVERQQGRGTFVTKTTPERALFKFFRVRRADGTVALPKLVSENLTERLPTKDEQRLLDTGRVYQIDRVRALDGHSEVSESIVLSAELFDGLGQRCPLPNALYALFEQNFGRSVEQIIERAWGEGDRLVVRREATDLSGNCIELRLSRYRLEQGLYYAVD